MQNVGTSIVGDIGNAVVPGCTGPTGVSGARLKLAGTWRQTSSRGLDLSFSVPVVDWPGIYTVVLHFSAAVQQLPSLFDIAIEGMVVAAAYSPQTGKEDVMLTIPGVATSDRTIDIKLIRLPSSVGPPTLSMLEIHSGSCTPAPVDTCEASFALPLPIAFAVPLANRLTEVAAVFSCQQLGWEPLRASGNTICQQSRIQGGCFLKKKSFADASEMCRAVGARLCTGDELNLDQQDGWNMCNLKRSPVWSSTTCELPKDPSMSAYVVATGMTAQKSHCKAVAKSGADAMGSLQCCADVATAVSAPTSPEPVQSQNLSASTCGELKWKVQFTHSDLSIVTGEGTPGAFHRIVCGQAQVSGNECRKDDIRFGEANKICKSVGGRLCTSAELRGGATRGTGCSLGKSTWVWSQTMCNQPGVPAPSFLVERAAQLDYENPVPGICWPSVGVNARASMQCCADELVASSDNNNKDPGANQIVAGDAKDDTSSFPYEIPLAVCGGAVAILLGVVATLAYERNRRNKGQRYSKQPSNPGSQVVASSVTDLDWDAAEMTATSGAKSFKDQAHPQSATFYEGSVAAVTFKDTVGIIQTQVPNVPPPSPDGDGDVMHSYYLAGGPHGHNGPK